MASGNVLEVSGGIACLEGSCGGGAEIGHLPFFKNDTDQAQLNETKRDISLGGHRHGPYYSEHVCGTRLKIIRKVGKILRGAGGTRCSAKGR